MLAKAVSPVRPCSYLEVMRRFALALIAVLALPAAAAAKGSTTTIAPPGNSGVSQYVETVPTAHGGQPTSSVHRGGAGSGHTLGGRWLHWDVGRRSGRGPVPSPHPRSAPSIPRGSPVERRRRSYQSTAPSGTRSSNPEARRRSQQRDAPATAQPLPRPRKDGASPASSVFHALTGSTSSGGLGLRSCRSS